jgi:hypothetical protein
VKLALPIILLFVCSLQCFGQKKPLVAAPRNSDVESRRLVFKFQPDRIAFSDYELGVECRFSKRWSIELEGGVTKSHQNYERKYIKFPQIYFGYYGYDRGTSLFGSSGSIGFRYYFKEKASALSQWYISPRFKYRRYNDQYYFKNYDYENHVDYSLTAKGYLNETYFSFVAGNQYWVAKNVSFDFYMGLAFGRFHGIYRDVSDRPPGTTGFYSGYYFKEAKYDRNFLFPILGLKFAVGF